MSEVAEELEAVITPVTSEELYQELARAWIEMLSERPLKWSVALLVAQWALETGWGKSMHCFNTGNIKSGASGTRCWTFFTCGEELAEAHANRLQAAQPNLVVIRKRYSEMIAGKPIAKASVYFRPKHPACRFRAYRTLREGVSDYLSFIRIRFSAAWPAVVIGNPGQFAHALKLSGYYTASEAKYAIGLSNIHSKLCRSLEECEFPVVSERERAEVEANIALSLHELAREIVLDDELEDEPPDSKVTV